MKIKLVLLLMFSFVQFLSAQDKSKISVFPFQNKSDKQYEWLTYGLSTLINESMNYGGSVEGISQDQVFRATSDPEINFMSALEGNSNPVLTKYQSDWNTHIFVIGNFTVYEDTLKVTARVCNLSKSSCGSLLRIQGTFQDYKSFYFLVSLLMESLYAELKSFDITLTPAILANSRDKTRQICADYEGYKAYIKSWMALRYYEDGLQSTDANKFDDAIRFFESARVLDESNSLAIQSNLSKVYLLRGNQFYGQTKWDDAAKDYSTAIQLNPMNSEAFYNLGNVFKNKKEYDHAVSNYRQSLEIDTANFEAYINIGYICVEQGHNSDAAAAYEKAIMMNETHAAAHYYAGVAYDNKGDAVLALKHYRRAIELDNAQAAAHLNLGILLKQQKDLAGARKEYEWAVQFDTSNATAHRNLGILLMNNKKEAALAAAHLQKCLDLDPGQPDAAIIKKNIGILNKKSGKKKK